MKIVKVIILLFFVASCGSNNSSQCFESEELSEAFPDCPTEAMVNSCESYSCSGIFSTTPLLSPEPYTNIEILLDDPNCTMDCLNITCEDPDVGWTFFGIDENGEISTNFGSGLSMQFGDGICRSTNPDLIQPIPNFQLPPPAPPVPDDCFVEEQFNPECPAPDIVSACLLIAGEYIPFGVNCTFRNDDTGELIRGQLDADDCDAIDCFTINCILNRSLFNELILESDLVFTVDENFDGSAIIDGDAGFSGFCSRPIP